MVEKSEMDSLNQVCVVKECMGFVSNGWFMLISLHSLCALRIHLGGVSLKLLLFY